MKDKFLWKEGELRLYKSDLEVTEAQKKRAEEAIERVIREFKEHVVR